MPRAPSAKSEKTRERIFQAALALFAEQGFTKTTMRQIATAADCSPGLAYRYFARKEDLALELYVRLSNDLERDMLELPELNTAQTFGFFMSKKLASLRPHRRALTGLVALALNPEAELGVLGDNTSAIRDDVMRVLDEALEEATDALDDAKTREGMVGLLYGLHLLLILIWVQDRSEGQAQTERVLELVESALGMAMSFVRTPLFSQLLGQLSGITNSLFASSQGVSRD